VLVELVGRGKLLWFDELATLSTANQPTWHRLFQSEVADGNPPIIYLLSRLSLHIFGQNQFALRLPELLGILLAGVCCFLFVRRTLDWPAGILAACALFFGHASLFAVEARPYGLLTGFSALMLVFWQAAARAETGSGRGALAGLALTGLAINLTHPYGVLFAFFPVFVGEAVRSYRNRRLDWPLIGFFLIGFIGQLVALPLAIETRRSLLAYIPPGGIPVARPSFHALVMSLKGQLYYPYPLIFSFVAVALWVAWRSSREDNLKFHEETAEPYWNDLAAAAALASMIVLVWCFSRVVTHYYFDRYGTPASVGLAILAALLLRRIPARATTVSALALSVTIQGYMQLHRAALGQPASLDPYLFNNSIPDEPVLVSSALAFSQEYWYADARQKQRLHFVGDVQRSRKMDDFIPELNLIEQSQRGLLPYRVEKLDDFLAQHRCFLLLNDDHFLRSPSMPADEWVPQELHRRGYRFKVLRNDIPGYYASIEQVAPPQQGNEISNGSCDTP
jgi:hypothetical protein